MTDLFSPEAMASYLVTVLATALSLLIIFLIVKKLLYKPIVAMVDKRKAQIASQLKEASDKNQEAHTHAKQAQAQLDASQAEAAKIVADANSRALLEAERVLKKAQVEALDTAQRAQESIKRERSAMIHEVRAEVTSLSMAIATKLVGEAVDNEESRQKLDSWIDERLLSESKDDASDKRPQVSVDEAGKEVSNE